MPPNQIAGAAAGRKSQAVLGRRLGSGSVRRTTFMNCPSCQKNVIPFIKLWLLSGFGTHRCPSCGAICRIRKSWRLKVFSLCLGGLVAFVGFHYRSWTVGVTAFMVALMVDAFVDARFRRLDLARPADESCA